MLPNMGIEINLKPTVGGSNRILPNGFTQILQNEYASKYLENIGANPTKENVEFVLTNLAIKDALVLPVWAREKIVIMPGMEGKLAEYQHMLIDVGTVKNKKDNKKITSKRIAPKIRDKDTKKVQFIATETAADMDNDSAYSMNSNEVEKSNRKRRELKKVDSKPAQSKMSLTTMHTLDLLQPLITVLRYNKKTADSFKSLLQAPHFDLEDIQSPIQQFVTSLVDYVPQVKNDRTGKLFKDIRKLLTSDKCVRLFGLLCHFCYWNTIHPAARATMRLLRDSDPTAFVEVDLNPKLETRIAMPEILMTKQRNQLDHLNLLHQHLLLQGDDSRMQHSLSFHENLDDMFESALQSGDEEQRRDGRNQLKIDIENEDSENDMGEKTRKEKINTATSNLLTDYTEDCARLNTKDLQSVCSLATEASLSCFEKEQLFMQLEACLISVFSKCGSKKAALVSSRQALVSCAHFVVDDILTSEYPWFSALSDRYGDEEDGNGNTSKATQQTTPLHNSAKKILDPELTKSIRELNLRLRRLAHQSMSDIIDPSRLYTSSVLLTALVGSDAKFLTSNSNMAGRAKYYGTSVAIKAVLGDSTSYKARKFFQRGNKLHSTLPGVVDPYVDPDPIANIVAKEASQRYTSDQLAVSARFEAQLFKREHVRPISSHQQHLQPLDRGTTDEQRLSSPLRRINTADRSFGLSAPSSSEGIRPRKHIDFSNLFSNQPEAGYFPSPAEELVMNNRKKNNKCGESDEEHYSLDEEEEEEYSEIDAAVYREPAALSPHYEHDLSVSSSGAFSMSKAIKKAQENADMQLINAIVNNHVSDVAMNKTKRFQRIHSTMNATNTHERNSSSFNIHNNMTQHQQHQQQYQQQTYYNFDQTNTNLYSSNHSVGSNSLLSHDRSLVYNKSAKMELSLKAKASLMTMVSNKAAHTYAAQPKTHQTLTRVNLIRSGGFPSSSTKQSR